MQPESLFEQWEPCILVVDDTPVNLSLLTKILESDWKVVSAASGAAALELAEQVQPALIILDVMMPVMDGYMTAEALQANKRLCGIPIIFLTALSDNESQIKGLSLGAVDFLTKPIDKTILCSRVANVLERERLLRAAMVQESRMQHELHQKLVLGDILESVFDASHHALIVADHDFCIIRLNERAEALLDEPQGGALGMSLRALRFLRGGEELALESGLFAATTPVECFLHNRRGRAIPVSASLQSFFVGDGDCHYLLSVRDLSLRHALESGKLAAETSARSMFVELSVQKNAIDRHELVSITDLKGDITFVNERFCAVSGYAPEELLGCNHRKLKSGLHPPAFYRAIWAAITRGQTWQGEIANRAKDGRIYWVRSTITPWINSEGQIYQYVSIRTDITPLKQAEEALRGVRERELKIAADIQSRLLFGVAPRQTPGFAIAYYTESSQGVDGDFYSFTSINEYCFDVLTGDVMGKGVAAALIGAGIKGAYLRVMIDLINHDPQRRMPGPAEIVNALHEAMIPELISLNAFVTLSLLRFDRHAQQVTWVNAGHTPLLLGQQASGQVRALSSPHLPIGVLEQECYEEQVTPLANGDTILLYSDGLSEAMSAANEQFGEGRIADIFQHCLQYCTSPSVILTSLRSQVHDHTEFAIGGDDRTALVIQMHPTRSTPRRNIQDRAAPEYLDLPRRLDQLTPLRQRIEALCADQTEHFTQALALAAFEVATNIVRHTPEKLINAPFTVVLTRSPHRAQVEFLYEGKPFTPPAEVEADFSGNASGGFGLYIIEHSVDRVSYSAPLAGIASVLLCKNFPDARHGRGEAS